MEAENNVIRRASNVVEHGPGVIRLIRSVLQHRSLIVELARRELTDPHAAQFGGFFWLIIHPLMMFLVYVFLFTLVFKVRIGQSGPEDYVVYLCAGLAAWFITQDALLRAAAVMMSNSTIVKKVMIPLEVLVAKTMLASLFAQGLLLILVVIASVWIKGASPIMALLLAALIPIHLLLLWGLALFLSVVTPYMRDILEILRVLFTVNMYIMPIMYIPEMVPPLLRPLLTANPFSHLIWCYQDALYFQSVAHPNSWLITASFAVIAACGGSYVFVRLRHNLSSVL
jgi:lipopolysaccharide transport system permease protein